MKDGGETNFEANRLITELAEWHPDDFRQLCACFPKAQPHIPQGSSQKHMAAALVDWARRQGHIERLVAEARKIDAKFMRGAVEAPLPKLPERLRERGPYMGLPSFRSEEHTS